MSCNTTKSHGPPAIIARAVPGAVPASQWLRKDAPPLMHPVIWIAGAPLSDAARFSINLLFTSSGHWLLPIISTRNGLGASGRAGAMNARSRARHVRSAVVMGLGGERRFMVGIMCYGLPGRSKQRGFHRDTSGALREL